MFFIIVIGYIYCYYILYFKGKLDDDKIRLPNFPIFEIPEQLTLVLLGNIDRKTQYKSKGKVNNIRKTKFSD